MQFQTNQDILFFVLTIVIAAIGVVVVWIGYYVIAMLHRVHKTLDSVTSGVERLQGLIATIQEAATRSTTHLSLIVSTIKELVSLYGRHRNRNDEEDTEDEEEAPKKKKR